jgi:hypothetical protein
MTIDPRWSIFLSLSLSILAFLAGASAQFADLGLTPSTTKAILAVITMALGIGNAVNAVLTGIPSKDNQTGFLVKGPKQP